MARPIWKGHISFGLVNVPVTLCSAENRSELHFTLLDSRDKARIHYMRVNEATGKEVPWDKVVRAYEYEEDNFVVLEDDDFKRAAVEATQKVEIEDFVDEKAVDYVYFDRPYYLVPDKKWEKAYVLMRETLRKSGKIGIAKVVIHTRQYLAAVIPQGNALVLNLLRYQHELRNPAEFELPDENVKKYKVSDKEFEMAEKLVETMTTEWKPEKYHDDYRDALMKFIVQKAKAGEKAIPLEVSAEERREKKRGEIIDIMDLLKKSVKQTAEKRKPGAGVGATRTRKKAASSGK